MSDVGETREESQNKEAQQEACEDDAVPPKLENGTEAETEMKESTELSENVDSSTTHQPQEQTGEEQTLDEVVEDTTPGRSPELEEETEVPISSQENESTKLVDSSTTQQPQEQTNKEHTPDIVVEDTKSPELEEDAEAETVEDRQTEVPSSSQEKESAELADSSTTQQPQEPTNTEPVPDTIVEETTGSNETQTLEEQELPPSQSEEENCEHNLNEAGKDELKIQEEEVKDNEPDKSGEQYLSGQNEDASCENADTAANVDTSEGGEAAIESTNGDQVADEVNKNEGEVDEDSDDGSFATAEGTGGEEEEGESVLEDDSKKPQRKRRGGRQDDSELSEEEKEEKRDETEEKDEQEEVSGK